MHSDKLKQLVQDHLPYAALHNHIDDVRCAIDLKVNLNALDKNGNLALAEATKANNIEIVRLLVAAGADVNAVDQSDLDAFYYSARRGLHEITQILRHANPEHCAAAAPRAPKPSF